MNKNLLSSIFLLIIVVGGFSITDTPRFGTAQAASEAPQVRFEKTYGPIEGHSIMQTADGGYAIAGYEGLWDRLRGPDGWTNFTFLLIKTDSQGKVMWNLAYGSTGRDRFTSVAQTADGVYVAASPFNAQFESSSATVVAKLDSWGNVNWAIEHHNRHNQLWSIIGTQDGGYAFTGYKALGSNTDITDVWFVKNTLPSDLQGAPSGYQETRPPLEPQDTFLTTWVVIAVVIVAGLGLGLLFYLIKRNR